MKKTNHIVLNASVVVVAKHHNPSILNPDFLKYNSIVDGEWEVADTLTTPPFAQTRYKNGITVTVDNERLNITQEINGTYQDDSPIYKLAVGYMQILKHVKYTAVGLNWNIIVPKSDPEIWLVEHFLKEESIPKSAPGLEELNLSMKFDLEGKKTNFQLSSGTVKIDSAQEIPTSGVIVRTNSHYDAQNTDEIINVLTDWQKTQELTILQIEKIIP